MEFVFLVHSLQSEKHFNSAGSLSQTGEAEEENGGVLASVLVRGGFTLLHGILAERHDDVIAFQGRRRPSPGSTGEALRLSRRHPEKLFRSEFLLQRLHGCNGTERCHQFSGTSTENDAINLNENKTTVQRCDEMSNTVHCITLIPAIVSL